MSGLTQWGRVRAQYYLGALAGFIGLEIATPERCEAFVVTKETTIEQFADWRRLTMRNPDKAGLTDARIRNRYKGYVQPVVDEIRADKELSEYAYLIIPMDNPFERAEPVLVKTRPVDSRSPTTLMSLNRKRHWKQGFAEVVADDVPFDQKDSRLIFRGACTGRWDLPEGEAGVMGARWLLGRRLPSLKDPRIDVGFTQAPGTVPSDEVRALKAAGGFKSAASVAEQLRCKYLLSLEGHDVASGLKWMLLSNSVVLMPKPRVVSWLMEDKLIPHQHYVPVAYDLSDLEEKLDWCEANQDVCREIARESTLRLQRFLDPEFEAAVRREVYKGYGERVRLVAHSPAYRGMSAANLTVVPVDGGEARGAREARREAS